MQLLATTRVGRQERFPESQIAALLKRCLLCIAILTVTACSETQQQSPRENSSADNATARDRGFDGDGRSKANGRDDFSPRRGQGSDRFSAGRDDDDRDDRDRRRNRRDRDDRDRDGRDRDDDFDEDDYDDKDDGGPGSLKKAKRVSLSFKGSRGDDVPGYLWLPDRRANDKFPLILVMYGISGDKDSGSVEDAALLLNKKGAAAVTIDWPGTGDRGDFGNEKRILKTDVLDWTVDDYEATLDYVTREYDVIDDNQLAYVGASMGAMTGINFVAKDSRIKATVAIVPIPNPLWGSKNPASKISRISHPVYCIYAKGGVDLSNTVCEGAGNNVETLALPGGHELENMRDRVVEEAVDFLEKQLDFGPVR